MPDKWKCRFICFPAGAVNPDTFVMTLPLACQRPYRPAKGIKRALSEIEKHKGEYYDPEAVDACVHLFRVKKFSFEKEALA